MDKLLNQLVDQITLATDYQKNKQALRDKMLVDLHMTYADGLFLVDMGLLSFLATWPDDDLFLQDVYGNPILIKRQQFLDQARRHYHAQMNIWHIEHEKLKRIRKI